ncbi:MAG TPA: hypothetical protein DIC52_05405 [Candidatus Latescibacteria bacterium]|nr:hypothetical protein [Candidatus Latescibacterota bacterium]
MTIEHLDHRKRLFVDMYDVDGQSNIRRDFHSAVKHPQPVLSQQTAWECHGGMTASVIFDEEEQLFKAWYMAGHYDEGIGHVQCLATSADGIHWERPDLGLHEALGSRKNNIVIPADYHDGQDHWETMLKDPTEADPARRYKAIGWSSYDWDGSLSGIYSATSPDGQIWSHSPEPLFRFHPRPGTDDFGPVGDAQSFMVDAERDRYVAFLRGRPERLMSHSDDFISWSAPRPFLSPLHEEEALYNNTGFNYGSRYLGVLTHFDKRPLQQTQSLRLLASRDGDAWDRPAGQALVSPGEIGEWDRFQIMLTGAPPIAVDDQLYLYYRGTSRRHAKVRREFDPRIEIDQDVSTMSIGLATLRLDGFASIAGSYDVGHVMTRPFICHGNELALNAKADHGHLRVELLTETEQSVEGYGIDDCVAVCEDGVDLRVGWGPEGNRRLPDQPVRLRFELTNARLYSYWCAGH